MRVHCAACRFWFTPAHLVGEPGERIRCSLCEAVVILGHGRRTRRRVARSMPPAHRLDTMPDGLPGLAERGQVTARVVLTCLVLALLAVLIVAILPQCGTVFGSHLGGATNLEPK